MLVFLMILCASTKKIAFYCVSDTYCAIQKLPMYDGPMCTHSKSEMRYMRRKGAHKQFTRTSLHGQDLSYFHITLLKRLTRLARITQHSGCYGNRISRLSGY